MSLIEILVTIFVLAVGLLAVVRVLIPGLAALPRAEGWARASVLCQDLARQVEAKPDLRPDSIERGLRINAADDLSGWDLIQDVSMGNVDQLSQSLSTVAYTAAYPNLVIGERFYAPQPPQVYVVECGPYQQGSLRVYYPEPWTQVAPGAESQPRTFSVTGNTVNLGPGASSAVGFMACYTVATGSGLRNIAGEVLVGVANPTLSQGVPIPYSVSLYELAPGVVTETTAPDLGRGGVIRFTIGAPEPGTMLACMYEIKSHVRDVGLDDPMVLRFPEEVDMPVDPTLGGIPVPDILSFDTYVPLNAPQRVKLPFANVAGYTFEGAPVPLDDTGDENLRAVNKVTGDLAWPGNGLAASSGSIGGTDGYVEFTGSFPGGTPVRIYYRVNGNWSVERHVAPASYSRLDQVAGQFDPAASGGFKQAWYTTWEDSGGTLFLTFHNLSQAGPPSVRFEDFWSGGPPVNTRSDGHRVSVDYRYATPDPNDPSRVVVNRVTGETHLVDFQTHSIALSHPNVVQIDAVRGISYKVRACFSDNRAQRSRVDVDTLAMR